MSFYFLFAKRKKKKKKNRKAFPYCNILAWVCIYSGGEGQGISDKKVLEQKEQGLPEKGEKKKVPVMSVKLLFWVGGGSSTVGQSPIAPWSSAGT